MMIAGGGVDVRLGKIHGVSIVTAVKSTSAS